MAIGLRIESWAALAPELKNKEDWQYWLQHPKTLNGSLDKGLLKQLPPMLRRRFGCLGRYAMGASLQILTDGEIIPSIFSSRHGDTALTLSLLEEMGKDEPMSPANFSLAVHNAVSGLFSIARKDTSNVTAIAPIEGPIFHALFEAVGQLQTADRVLCVIYDIPLPELYRRYCASLGFPFAIAIILSRKDGEAYDIEQISQCEKATQNNNSSSQCYQYTEHLRFIELLTGLSAEMESNLNGSIWRMTKAKV